MAPRIVAFSGDEAGAGSNVGETAVFHKHRNIFNLLVWCQQGNIFYEKDDKSVKLSKTI